jgi:hypothetical protein
MSQQRYSPEFEDEAARQVTGSEDPLLGVALAQDAQELG